MTGLFNTCKTFQGLFGSHRRCSIFGIGRMLLDRKKLQKLGKIPRKLDFYKNPYIVVLNKM